MNLVEVLREMNGEVLNGDWLATFITGDELAEYSIEWRKLIIKDLGQFIGPNVRRIYVNNGMFTIILKDDSRIVIYPSASEIYINCFWGKPILPSLAFATMKNLAKIYDLGVEIHHGKPLWGFNNVDWIDHFSYVQNNNSLTFVLGLRS
jgi:hypothetical protein